MHLISDLISATYYLASTKPSHSQFRHLLHGDNDSTYPKNWEVMKVK